MAEYPCPLLGWARSFLGDRSEGGDLAPSWAPLLTRRIKKKLRVMARIGDLVADASNAVWHLTAAELWDEVPTPVISLLRAQVELLLHRLDDVLAARGLR